ncbi:MAG: cysteine desulfurase family protein, partial [Gemmatimonadota bacterium]
MENVYLDHAATAPTRDEVWDAMSAARGEADFNAASTHAFGRDAGDRLEEARRTLAGVLDAPRSRVRFTGGGTASDNLAVLGFARAHPDAGPRLLVSEIEHRAVLEAAGRASREGAEVTRLPVDGDGVLRLDALERALEEGEAGRPTLVSVMWANNEIGSVQPVAEACEVAHEHGALFHTDAVQALGKVPVSVEEVPVDLLSATAHKLGGPVGIGLLYAAEGADPEPLFYGGEQEKGAWPGTQNPLGAVGFAEAARLAEEERPEIAPTWREWRRELERELTDRVDGLRVRAEGARERLPHLLNVGIPGCDQAALLVSLDMEAVAV